MILVTGGAGFIGSNFVLDWLAQSNDPVVNLDALTYAGNLENLAALQGDSRHIFVKGGIGDIDLVARLLAEHQVRAVVNFAAECHVDRSIHGPEDFIQTNIVGTFRLLEAVRAYWTDSKATPRPTSVSSTFPLTKSMARSEKMNLPSPRPIATNPTAHTPPARPPVTTWCAPTTIPTPAGPHHQLLQQLRALPFPGKTYPAGDPQCLGRQAPAHLWRWPADPRLAIRQGPLQRHSTRPRSGQGRRGLQRWRLERKT